MLITWPELEPMKLSTTAALFTRLLLAVVLSASPLAAQQKRGTTPRKPAPPVAQPAEPGPSFDSLLADDSYKVYVEVRDVGQLIRASALNDLLDPLMKMGGSTKQFKAAVKWLNVHAESLAGSRMFVASWPSKTNLPAVLVAIEFSSPEEAQKFEPDLRRFIPTVLPTPAPNPSPDSASNNSTSSSPLPQTSNPALPYHIKHIGSLVLVSDKAFAFRDLKPHDAKLLAEDQNFVTARNRLSSESLFLYVDVKAIEKEEQDRRKRYEEENQKLIEQESSRVKEDEKSPEVVEPAIVEDTELSSAQEPPPPPANGSATLTSSSAATVVTQDGVAGAGQDPQLMNALMSSLYGALLGGQPKWPEGVAASLAFEGDTYVVRTLILGGAENKAVAIPFLPQFVSGPPLIPGAPGVLPADANLFISASLDYPQIYEGMLKTIANMNERSRGYSTQTVSAASAASPFAEYEKKLGLKIKDDVLPLLGNELALAMVPKSINDSSANPTATPAAGIQQKARTPDPDPVVAIAVKDKDAMRRLIPKLIETMAGKGANMLAQTERKEDTEITSYANMFSYAFVGDFLILSSNAEATKRAVASYLSGETLSSNSHFRNANNWQSRQLLAQVYMAPGMVQTLGLTGNPTGSSNEKMAELFSRLDPYIEAVTYSLSNEGSGPLHELHLPKNLLMHMVASLTNDAGAAPTNANEAAVKSELRTLVAAEAAYSATTGDGRYGTIDELVKAGLLSKEPIERYGYEIELAVSAKKFEATAVPIEYGKSGSLSYFVDESGVVRGGDRAGGPATISDPPIQ
ncbi:MAG TPA: hypothetical protein DC047_00715 [Blastocatellia bacterium]|nr:hypothetical protein [Blastocatellia bacterium]